MFTDSNLKIRSIKKHASLNLLQVLNLLSNFVLHGKSFYGCSTSGLKNIRKVICGDPSQTLKTPRDLQPHSENMPNARSQLKKAPANLNSVPTENTQFPFSGFYDVLSPF